MTSGGSCHVFLVDDDPEFLGVLEAQLVRLRSDFEVTTATDPASALDRLESGAAVDCIVSDYRMPEMTGIDFLHAVRDRGIDVPFVMLTGEGDESVASEAIDAGAANYLRKGSTSEHVERLAEAVEEAVSTHRERRILRQEFQFLDRVLGTLDDIVYVIDISGRPLYWNEAANQVTGYDSAEVRSLDVFDLFPSDEHDRVQATIDAVLDDGSETFEAELLTKGGDRIPYEFSNMALQDQDGNVVGVCGVGRDITRRVHYERTLRSLHDTTRTLLEATNPETIASIVAGATEHIVNNPLSTVFLREDDRLTPAASTDELRQVVGTVPEYDLDEDVPVSRVFRTGDPELFEDVSRIDDDRNRKVRGVLYLPLGQYGVLALARRGSGELDDIDRQLAEVLAANAGAALQRLDRELALEFREWMLETLHGTTQELIRTTDRIEIGRVLIDDASRVLGLSASAVFLWDDKMGTLELAAETDAFADSEEDYRTVVATEHPIWQTFVTGESRVVTGTTKRVFPQRGQTSEDTTADSEDVRSRLLVPIDGHGVLVSVLSERDAFDESDREFAELLATTASTALERTERERSLRQTEQRLEDRYEQLRRVNRLNTIIRDINEALLQATSRAEVQQVVCETLLDVDHYAFTWIGDEGPSGGLVSQASAGEGRGLLDTLLGADETPIPKRVLEEDEPIVIDNVHRDERVTPWRAPTLNRGFRSLACVPLTYGDYGYGVLEIYADRPGIFSDEEGTVLSELADQIANAIHAVEHRTAMLSGGTTELELELRDVEGPLFHLAHRVEMTIDVDGLTPHGPNAWNVYATVHESDPTAVLEAIRESAIISNEEVLRTDTETTLLKVTVAEFSIADVLADAGVTVRAFHVDPGAGRVTVTVPTSTDVRSFLESCRKQFPDVRLVRRQPVTDASTPESLKYDIDRLLTDKQLNALQTAYFKGYFEWPREATGEEIAATMGVSRPTFQQHLRKALARIFEDTFENG